MKPKNSEETGERASLFPPDEYQSYDRKLVKVGGSVVVSLPSKLRKQANICPGDYVSLGIDEHGRITITRKQGRWGVPVVRTD